MTRALDIITDAYERCNRLAPGETLSADDAAFGLRRLNLLVDELRGQNLYLFKDTLVSVAQTGNITLGSGDWASIAPGAKIVGGACNNLPLESVTVEQYNEQYRPFVTGRPSLYAYDDYATVYLWPSPLGQTITLQTRETVQTFADQTTNYVVPAGWQNALGAALAVRIAPNILGQLPPALTKAEKAALDSVSLYDPAIVDVYSYDRYRTAYPRRLF